MPPIAALLYIHVDTRRRRWARTETKTFRSGNSEAVRLPKGMGFGIGVDVRVEREPGGRVVLTPIHDREAQRREMDRIHQAMLAIGAPADGVQPRDPFVFVERPGLE